ncbi:hypothetical protein GCM10023085_18850 [Actinomadura viridis]
MSPTRPVGEPAESPARAADELLANVEPLPYPRRMRELALHARRLAGTPELTALLDELSGRGPYERRTALHMAMAARDLDRVAAVLAGPDMALRRAALRAVRTLPVPDEAAAAALDDAPSGLRRAFYRTLLHSRRTALADRLLPAVRERWGDREAAVLLPACTGPVVARELPGLAHAVVAWRTLGRRHPGPVLDDAERELARTPFPVGFWRRRGAGVDAAAAHAPGRVLSLFEGGDRAPRLPALSPTALGTLVRAEPRRMVRVLLGTAWPSYPGVRPEMLAHLRTCPQEEITARVPSRPWRLRSFLEALPPERREAAFDAAAERGADVSAGLRAMDLLDLLPAPRAAREARRMLDWHGSAWHSSRSHANDPDLPLRLQAFLPYDEAEAPLREAAFSGDPHRRGLARALWLECAARTGDRAVLARVLGELAARTANDQDPVRGAVLGALAKIGPARFDDGFAEPFGLLSGAAVDARDSSVATRRLLRLLAARVLRHSGGTALDEWGLGVYVHLLARHGIGALAPAPDGDRPRRRRTRRRPPAADDHRLDRVLRRGRERDLLDRLGPHLRAARRRGEFGLAVAVAASLGRRAHGLGELQDDLRAAILQAPEDLARRAAGLWLAEPRVREDRAAGLLDADPAVIALPAVWDVVARRRTDLLGPVLDGDPPAEWAPRVAPGGAGRWTPAQRERVRALLQARADDEDLPVTVRTTAAGGLGRLPGTLERLASWAEREDDVLAETALDALGHGEDPERNLRVLLTLARGRGSRTAGAALARCCAAVPPSRLGPLLSETLTGPDTKVTVRRHAVRQLERHRPPGAAGILLRAWNDPRLHKDVRVAVAVALRRMPEVPGVLEALGDAAGPYNGDVMLRTLFQAQPWEYAPEHRPRYAALVRRLLSAAGGPGVRFRASRAFGAWVPWYEGGFGELLTAVGDPGDPVGGKDMPAFLALMRAGVLREEVLEVLDRLLETGTGPEARARVTTITGALGGHRTGEPRRELAARAAGRLAAHPLYLGEAMRLAVLHLPGVRPGDGEASGPPPAGLAGDLATALAAMAARLRDRPMLAAEICARHLGPFLRTYGGGCAVPPALLLPAVRRLLEEGHPVAGLMAVTLTGIAGEAAGWPGEWRALLDRLRGSDVPDVAERAWEVTADAAEVL